MVRSGAMGTGDRANVGIDVERAVLSAIQALPKFLGGRSPVGVRVEEVVPPGTSAMGAWRVTLSHLEPGVEIDDPVRKALLGAFRPAPPPERVLRVIEVDAETGDARAMKLREAS